MAAARRSGSEDPRSQGRSVAERAPGRRRRTRFWWQAVVFVVVVAVVTLLAQHTSGAVFTAQTANGADQITSDTLQPASNLAVTQTCSSGSPVALLSWTQSPSTYAAGYQLTRTSVPTQTISPSTTTTATDGPLAGNTSYSWQLVAYAGNWTSSSISASLTTTPCVASLGAPSPNTGGVGSSVTITGSGFLASAPLTVTFGSVAATLTSGGTTSAAGAVNVTFTVPFSGNGSYAVTVSDGTNSLTSATTFTVTGSFDGLMFTGASMTGGSPTTTCLTPTISRNVTCTASGVGGTGSFTGSVTFVTAGRSAVPNTGAVLTVTSSVATVTAPGGTVTPASSIVSNGASTTSTAFTLTGRGVGWKATVTCSVTVNGVTYTVAVTAN